MQVLGLRRRFLAKESCLHVFWISRVEDEGNDVNISQSDACGKCSELPQQKHSRKAWMMSHKPGRGTAERHNYNSTFMMCLLLRVIIWFGTKKDTHSKLHPNVVSKSLFLVTCNSVICLLLCVVLWFGKKTPHTQNKSRYTCQLG